MHEAQKNVCPLGAPRAGGAFGFLDTLKVHIQSYNLVSTNLSFLQTKLVEKNNKLIFDPLHSLVSDLKSVIALHVRPWTRHS